MRKLLTITLFVSIIGACLEIDNRGALPAPVSWQGKIPPPQLQTLEVIDRDVLGSIYDVAPKSIPVDFECAPCE